MSFTIQKVLVVDRKRLVTDGKLTTIDVDKLRQELFEQSQWSTNRQSQAVDQIESHYRSVMGLPEIFQRGYS